uniref:Ig-like domain-containing protein n=1 Tax=Sparus aurata TaxID=8175 RepID=A0A671WGM9_SPAAU
MFSSSSECKGADRVIQPTGDVIVTEGDTVTLDCKFETSNPSYYLFWYKQDGNNSPKFILSRIQRDDGNSPDEFKERFSSTLDSTSKSGPLKIQKLQLSDSSVYYCALQPTVTGNTKTLYKNLWSKDNTILHNIHSRESHTMNPLQSEPVSLD